VVGVELRDTLRGSGIESEVNISIVPKNNHIFREWTFNKWRTGNKNSELKRIDRKEKRERE
jgi:hypothetical protein